MYFMRKPSAHTQDERLYLTSRRVRSAAQLLCGALLALACWSAAERSRAEPADVIARIKPSIVAVGTFQPLRNPPFAFRGTGFAVGDGTLVVTNHHVLPAQLDSARKESLVVAIPGPAGSTQAQARQARAIATDKEYDLALLRIEGPALPALELAESAQAREGQAVLFTGFPIGPVLGLIPATHRAMVSALTPIALPARSTRELSARAVTQLAGGAYKVLQLDGTAYPGNSGSPLYDARSGQVIGVINMVFVKGTKEAALTQPSGISYAIPVQPLIELIKRIAK
jgi:S1-C subfamily serine protease